MSTCTLGLSRYEHATLPRVLFSRCDAQKISQPHQRYHPTHRAVARVNGRGTVAVEEVKGIRAESPRAFAGSLTTSLRCVPTSPGTE